MSQGNLGGTFDANKVAPQQSFEPMPTGWYKAMAIDSEVKPTSAGTGTRLSIEWQIIEGEHSGRKVFDNINLANPNPKCAEIGQAQLSAICHATGALQVADSTQLHNLPCLIRVKIRPPEGQYDAGNEVKGYRHVNDPPRTMQATAAPAIPAPAPAPQMTAPTVAPAPSPQAPPAPAPQQVAPAPTASPQPATPAPPPAPAAPVATTAGTGSQPPWVQ